MLRGLTGRIPCMRQVSGARTRLYISVKSRFGLVRVPSMSKMTPRSTGRDAVAMLLEREKAARCDRQRTRETTNMRSRRQG